MKKETQKTESKKKETKKKRSPSDLLRIARKHDEMEDEYKAATVFSFAESDWKYEPPDFNEIWAKMDEVLQIVSGENENAGTDSFAVCERTDGRSDNSPAFNKGSVGYRENFGGFDGGVEAGFDGTWDSAAFEALTARLDEAKQEANDGHFDGQFVRLDKKPWKVWPKGSSSAGSGPKYKFILEHHGVKLYIHSNPQGDIQPVRVRFGAVCLMQTDLYSAVNALKELLAKIGFRITSEKLTRVDMQVMLERPFKDFQEALKPGHVVTRCRGKLLPAANLLTKKLETLSIRSSSMELCIYDKKAELNQSDYVYYVVFDSCVLNGYSPEHLTRVEFRFRRETLKRFGVNTFEDLRLGR